MRHHLRTRIVIANSARARWVEREGEAFATLTELEANRATTAHAASTVHQRFGEGRHGAGEVDLARKGTQRFASEIAERINDEDRRADFERLAIVAPPRMLGAIREALSPSARAKVVHELPKDLTKASSHRLHTSLSSVLFG